MRPLSVLTLHIPNTHYRPDSQWALSVCLLTDSVILGHSHFTDEASDAREGHFLLAVTEAVWDPTPWTLNPMARAPPRVSTSGSWPWCYPCLDCGPQVIALLLISCLSFSSVNQGPGQPWPHHMLKDFDGNITVQEGV